MKNGKLLEHGLIQYWQVTERSLFVLCKPWLCQYEKGVWELTNYTQNAWVEQADNATSCPQFCNVSILCDRCYISVLRSLYYYVLSIKWCPVCLWLSGSPEHFLGTWIVATAELLPPLLSCAPDAHAGLLQEATIHMQLWQTEGLLAPWLLCNKTSTDTVWDGLQEGQLIPVGVPQGMYHSWEGRYDMCDLRKELSAAPTLE